MARQRRALHAAAHCLTKSRLRVDRVCFRDQPGSRIDLVNKTVRIAVPGIVSVIIAVTIGERHIVGAIASRQGLADCSRLTAHQRHQCRNYRRSRIDPVDAALSPAPGAANRKA